MKLFSWATFCVLSCLLSGALLNVQTVFAGSCSCAAGKISINAAAKLIITDDQRAQAKKMCTSHKGSFDDDAIECNNASIVIQSATDTDCQKNTNEGAIMQSLDIPSEISPFISIDNITCSFGAADTPGAYIPNSSSGGTQGTPSGGSVSGSGGGQSGQQGGTGSGSGGSGGGTSPSGGSGSGGSSPASAPGTPPAPNPADAGGGIFPPHTGKCPEDYMKPGTKTPLGQGCIDGAERDYALDDIKSFLAILGNLMLGVSGAVVLFCFVLGGFFWLASAGNEKMVDRGKTLISGAVIGLIIMFTAYTLVVFAVKTLAGSEAAQFIPSAKGPAKPGAKTGPNSVIKGTITTVPSGTNAADACTNIGYLCAPVNKCTTSFALIGACPDNGSTPQDCCVDTTDSSQQTNCGKIGGVCQDTGKTCAGAYVKGLCTGGNDTQCCIKI